VFSKIVGFFLNIFFAADGNQNGTAKGAKNAKENGGGIV